MRFWVFTLIVFFSAACGGKPYGTLSDDVDKHDSPDEEYRRILDNYYYLDGENFSEIKCKILVLQLNEMVEAVSQMAQRIPGKLDVENNLEKFSLTYSRDGRVEFEDPEFNARIISLENAPDPERAKQGIDRMNKGFSMTVGGIKTFLINTFALFKAPDLTALEDLTVDRKGEFTEVTFKLKQARHKLNYYPTRVIGENTGGPGVEMKVIGYYQEKSGRKVLDKIDMDIKIDPLKQSMKMKVGIEYQRVNGVIFPGVIKAESEISTSAAKMNSQFNVELSECTL